MDYVAITYDEFVEGDPNNRQPVCLVFTFVGINGFSSFRYMTTKEAEDASSLYVSRALFIAQHDFSDIQDTADANK